MKRVLPILIVLFLFNSCSGRRFSFEYESEPWGAAQGLALAACQVTVIPEDEGFRVMTEKHVPERVAKIQVQAKEVTRLDIYDYEPDARLILGTALSTVAGLVVTPVWCVKRLFTGWGDPDGEEAMRQRLYDRHLRSWLLMGYLWAPVDYEVLDRRQINDETGKILTFDASDETLVTVLDEQRRPVAIRAYGNGRYRPVLTDTLLESGTLYVTAACGGGAAAVSIDLMPWYRREFGLKPEEVMAFKTLGSERRPSFLKLSPDLRSDFLALDEPGWKTFEKKVPLASVGERVLAKAALGASNDRNEKDPLSYEDDLPGRLKSSRPLDPHLTTWLFAMGIEAYDKASPIAYSRRSAELFTRVAMNRLGVPAENVFLLNDDGTTEIKGLKGRTFPATAASIQDELRFLLRDVGEGDRIYVYYSGHGLPSLKDGGAPYLLARDQAPDFIHESPFFRIDTFFQTLSQSRAAEIVVFMDSCFTGVADGTSVFGNGRAATRLVPKAIGFDDRRMAVITAGTDRQFSNMYPEKGHRLFSYFLMKELMNDHDTLESLYQRVSQQTRRISRSRGGTQLQEPTARGNLHMRLRFE
ncbi:caspase family protein [Desulfoluna sp.]|uniref:caspase family protein n=1 Tax=Desulfoluna sp. TaxID=2045199 RepID=UPI002627C47D|nr:caspase family protein [Desulfoluna sp.]